MAKLVTLDQARDHLNVTATDKDQLIEQKIEHASATILDYLKGRANNTAVITGSSIASPTVITTEESHTFTNGMTAVITGDVDGVPTINGSWTISGVLGASFTIPLAVTTPSTGALATVVWDDVTAPAHVQAAVLLWLTHLYEHRGDDMEPDGHVWMAIERLLMRARDPAFA